MQYKNEFYNNYQKDHDGTHDNIDSPRIRVVIDYLTGMGKINNLLNIGCGVYGITPVIKNACHIDNYYACDIFEDVENRFEKMGITFAHCDLDTDIPFSDKKFDVIVCTEVIEHLFSPDNIFKYAVKTLNKNGCLLITTPNLGAWFNRLVLLFGYQPAFSEVSDTYNVGKLFSTYKDKVSGHLRMFTLKALIELGECHGLKTVHKASTGGGDDLIGRITTLLSTFPSLGSNLFCVMKKK